MATDAAQLLLFLAFDNYELRTVKARLDGRNRASARLCVRLGMEQTGIESQDGTSGGLIEVHTYEIAAERWREHRDLVLNARP